MYVIVYAKKSNLMTSDNIWIVTQVIFATCFIMFHHVSSLSSFIQDSVILYLVMFEGSFRLKKKKDTNHPPGPFTQWWRWRSKGTWRYPDRIWSKRSRYVKILISCAQFRKIYGDSPPKAPSWRSVSFKSWQGHFHSHKLSTSTPCEVSLKVIDGPLQALSIRVMLTTAPQNLQFLGRTENAQVLSLDVHDWYGHGDTKETTFHMHRQIYLERSVWV